MTVVVTIGGTLICGLVAWRRYVTAARQRKATEAELPRLTVPALPAGSVIATVSLYRAPGDGTDALHCLSVTVAPADADTPRLMVHTDDASRPVDAAAEPEVHAAAAALVAALMDAADSPLAEKRSR